MPATEKERNNANNANLVKNAAEVASKTANPYAKAAGTAVKIADKVSGGKASQSLGKVVTNANKFSPGGRMLQNATNKMNESGTMNRISNALSKKNSSFLGMGLNKFNTSNNVDTLQDEQSTPENEDSNEPSVDEVTVKLSPKVKKILIYISPAVMTGIVFCCLFIAASQTFINVIGLDNANKSSEQINEDIENSTDEDRNEQITDDNIAYNYSVTIEKPEYAIPYFLVDTKKIKKDDKKLNLSDLEDYYGANSDIEVVHKFYSKLQDIYDRYLFKNNVSLDLPLIMSTLMIQSKNMNTIFISNTSEEYDRENIQTVDSHILDYNHDWTGYRIIKENSSHDIEILAQNMVSIDANGKYFLDYDHYNEFLKEFLEKKYLIEGGGIYTGRPEINSGGTCTNTFTKYDLSDEQLSQIASLAYHEQGTAKGSAAEASLMANLFELKGSKYGEGATGLYNYIRTSGWFANSEEFMDSKDASEDIINAVKSVLVDGKRTLPAYIDEHDMFDDITAIETDGLSSTIKDRNSYVEFKTKITNRYGSQYIFYSFPDTNSDPFGYTSEKIREEKGEFYYDFDTGEPQNCETNSVNGTDLSSAFVSLAVSQLNDPSKNGGEKYWKYMGFNSRVAWCASFVSWNIYNTEYNGQKLSDIISHKSAAVDSFMNYFYQNSNPNIKFYYNDSCSTYKGKNGNSGTYIPKEGDLIFFDNTSKWNGSFPVNRTNLPNRHIGIVQYVKDGQVITIEGNSGDKTKENKFSLSSCRIIGFGSWY